MATIKYIDYNELDEFYSIPKLCKLFSMTKKELRYYCEKFSVVPRQNEIGEWGFVKYDVRMLHNKIYKSEKANSKETRHDDPWGGEDDD